MVEDFPDVKALTTEGQLRLAAELIDLATDSSVAEPNELILKVLNERRSEYLNNPESASKWSDVKARILAKHNERD